MNKLLASVVALTISIVAMTKANPILGGSVYVSKTGTVDATFLSNGGAYTNLLGLYYWDANSSTFTKDNVLGTIFNNQVTVPGTTVNLGNFTAGQELVFGIYVTNENYTAFTGSGSRNPDGLEHAIVNDDYTYNNTKGTYVGFEDLFNGGDRDYDDLTFFFTNTSNNVPEPSIIALLGVGLSLLAFKRKRS